MQPLKTIVVDPNRLSREGLRDILNPQRIEVIREARRVGDISGDSDHADGSVPDLILVNCGPDTQQARLDLHELRSAFSKVRIVVLSSCDTPEFLRTCFEAPIDGLVSQNITSAVLLKSLDLVLAGERVFPSYAIARLLDGNTPPATPAPAGPVGRVERSPLSERELEVISCLVAGWSNKTIALHLDVTEATVKVHLKSILRKIDVRNRTQAAIWALGHGIRPGGSDGENT